jgi:hypothetical protein
MEDDLERAKKELNEAKETYEKYLRSGLVDKARHFLPTLNRLEDELAFLTESDDD